MRKDDGCLNFVCISPAPWDYPIWTNRQHIMARIAEEHKVLYVFHPLLSRSSIKRNISLNKFKLISTMKKINNNLSTFTPFIIPFANNLLGGHRFNIIISSLVLKRILKRISFDEYILWFYDPEAVEYMNYLRPKLSCYDCVDDYSTMPSYSSTKERKDWNI